MGKKFKKLRGIWDGNCAEQCPNCAKKLWKMYVKIVRMLCAVVWLRQTIVENFTELIIKKSSRNNKFKNVQKVQKFEFHNQSEFLWEL